MTTAIRTGAIKTHRGLVDYIAEGELIRDGESIPCEIGYNEYPSYDPERESTLRADYIFIKSDGVTKNGNHYEKGTINLTDYPYSIIDDEEV